MLLMLCRLKVELQTYIGLQFSVRMFVVSALGGNAQEPDDSG
jgi:hypothetical protein